MYSVSAKSALAGEICVPGSKSHTIRAALLSAMAEGTSVVNNPPASGDCLSALKAARAFGAEVTVEPGRWIIRGTGGKLALPEDVLDCGNSGTTVHFAMSMAALCDGWTVISGDDQIRHRPVIQLVNAINELGGRAFLTRPDAEAPPVVIRGIRSPGSAHVSGFNSQVVSSILLSSPLAAGDTVVLVENPLEKPYVQMTLDWMGKYGVEIRERADDYTRFVVPGRGGYRAAESLIPGDWSGVLFPLAAAVCAPSELCISGLDFNDPQGDKTAADFFIAMGADIRKDLSGGRLIVRGGKPLRGGLSLNLNDIPDSLPALAAAACFAEGETTFTGLAHVRVKETDRVAVMQAELSKLGAKVSSTAESMTVAGGFPLQGADVESHGDHRVAMALAVAGLCAEGRTRVKDAECAAISFPGFFDLMRGVGASIELCAGGYYMP